MADGRLNYCKACVRARVLTHRTANLEAVRAYDRQRALLPHRKAKTVAIVRRWREKHPDRRVAHLAAQRAHRKAPSCCQMCGLPKRLERHHPDYALPLLIVWLCKPCHAIADAARRDRPE